MIQMPIRRAAAALALLLTATLAVAQNPAVPRAQVMVLGTYHMDNPGRDYANPTVDDVLAPRRQAEIEAVVRALAEFRPTRIAIEATPSRDSLHNARYHAYRAGSYRLGRNVANWYARNLHIYANIARVAQPGERVLVIMGSGHRPLLRQFVAESPELELVPAERYLARFRTAPAMAR